MAELAEANNMSLVTMTIGFMIRHPGVSAAIIGPRTMDQLTSQLDAAHFVLSDVVLDKIDEIVCPRELTLARQNPPGITQRFIQKIGDAKEDYVIVS